MMPCTVLFLIIRAAKRDYLCDKIRHCSSIRLLYSVTDELMGRTTEPKLPTNIPLLDLPNTFSDFMHEKIANIRRVLDSCPVPASFEPFAGTGFCTFAPVSEDLIRKLINDAPPKCCALDLIPTALLKTCYENLVPVITKIVNYSLLSGCVPQCFKQALVRPFLKKPSLDQNMLKNYRPVSNLSFLSKLLERVVLLQLTDHVSRNDLLERNQSAYRQNHSTETALLHITNCLLESIDQGRVSILSLLDLSAAFDTIDHNILLERLHTTFGISGSAPSVASFIYTGQISGRCCKQHLIHPTTPGLWGPSGISVGTIALCSLYTARFTRCPPVRF